MDNNSSNTIVFHDDDDNNNHGDVVNSGGSVDVPPEVSAAYTDARLRGLPDGWTCSIDKRNRRKWTAPNNGRSCDSIPKAIAISVELGLLPADTTIPSGRKKKKARPSSSSSRHRDYGPRKRHKQQQQQQHSESNNNDDHDEDNDEDDREEEETSEADAAASLLFMGSGKSVSKPANASVVKTNLAQQKNSNDNNDDDDEKDEESEEEEEDDGPPLVPMDAETTLDVYSPILPAAVTRKEATLPSTVHWDPHSPNGRKIGWKVKIENTARRDAAAGWIDGRVVRYDPHTHKHKIEFSTTKITTASSDNINNKGKKKQHCWIWLRNEQHNIQLASRMVWAHVKGYAWWPGLVMESNADQAKTKEGYVLIEFFVTGEISCLRDTLESVRPFDPQVIDAVVAKHRKKRNQAAYQAAMDEYAAIQTTRNQAALYYAKAALDMACYYAPGKNVASSNNNNNISGPNGPALIGKRIQIFRPDIDYPYGDTVIGKVRQYSIVQKKWLISFELSEKQNNRTKYPPAWINVYSKEHVLKVLPPVAIAAAAVEAHKGGKASPFSGDAENQTNNCEELVPFLFGFEPLIASSKKEATIDNGSNDHLNATKEMLDLLNTRCKGCVEYLKTTSTTTASSAVDQIVTCDVCHGSFHLNCLDPPLTVEAWQRMWKAGPLSFTCVRCTPCRGCYNKDISFGSHSHPNPPPTLTLPNTDSIGSKLDLCSMCKVHYDADRFCSNCAHIWDDKKFAMIRRQMEHGSTNGRKRKGASSRDAIVVEDSGSQLVFGYFEGDEEWPLDTKFDPVAFDPETSEWGFTEDEMLVCDNCNVWVHAGCSGVTEDEYEVTSNGDHPIYSKEFLCRMCCRKRCTDLIEGMQYEDKKGLFAAPVSEKVVPNYLDLIKEPMDLKTMYERASVDEYINYVWVRELFELMVLNALTFNRYYTDVWREAKRFYYDTIKNVFSKFGKAAPPGWHTKNIQKCFDKAEEARKNEEERVQVDESVVKKDLVAGSAAVLAVTFPKLRESPPDLSSCVPFRDARLKSVDAFFCSWMDCCFTCGSSGAADTFLFCVDCGEAFHSFCVSAPVHSMELSSVAGWRCPNCKICEISGEVPADETRMLFCEMCDRGFSLDLVDPPLKSAPSGLWICGQCVDCSICRNKGEKKGVSLKNWSQDPERCFRCGGCDGFDAFASDGKCQVCTGALRSSDDDVIQCSKCRSKVHLSCDDRAEGSIDCEANSEKQGKSSPLYLCPGCYKPSARAAESAVRHSDRIILSSHARQLITEAGLGDHDNYTDVELHQKLVDEIDWEIRYQWQNEYVAIIQDAIRLYCMAKTVGDPRFVIQQVLQRTHHLPDWLGHRALRFAVLVKRKKWDVQEFTSTRADVIVLTAKLAAAFIDIVCRTLGINKDRDVSFSDRQADLVQAPNAVGEFICPFDRIKLSTTTVSFDENGCVVNDPEQKRNDRFEERPVLSQPAYEKSRQVSCSTVSPLIGWSSLVHAPVGITEWRDPRECCLCHFCGDSDAGLPDDAPPKDLDCLGRLLPMSNGYWIHTSCALWSSEVWEAPDDGLVHATEKAKGRGAQLKCFGCGFSGATVGCNKSNCPYNYHLPCARACGAVFTLNQQVFCSSHKSSAISILAKDSCELMKALIIAPEKQKSGADTDLPDNSEIDLFFRLGALVVHSLGTIEQKIDGFHTEDYITPPGYVASRIFWSSVYPRTRTVYIVKIEKCPEGRARFEIIAGDAPTAKIAGSSVTQVYSMLMKRIQALNSSHFSKGDPYSKLPVARKTKRKTYGLNGPQFFGFGLNNVRRLLESIPGVEAVAAPLTPNVSPQYRFCFVYGAGGTDSSLLVDAIRDIQRKRAAAEAEQALENSTGCARTEGIRAVVKSGGSGRITRALVRIAEDDIGDTGTAVAKKGEEKVVTDKSMFQVKYRKMKSTPIEQRLAARRSHIHGWGLFTKQEFAKHDPVIEYMGEVIRQPVADRREKAYEESGEGSCFMFRLDMKRIIDATKIGCMARFMNHSCQPNAYAKVMSVDTELGQEKKIVVLANRDIAAGEEVTYDYKFPVEDGSLRCMCGAPNCIGRLN